jgi:mono/diheme cytochrome c family protein
MLVGGCRGGESEEPPVHLIQNMYTQEKAKPYRKDDTGLFPDGRTMHQPIEGTVAIGQLFDDDLYDNGIDPHPQLIDGGTSDTPAPSIRFPPQILSADGGIDDDVVERGHLRYNIYCSPCHGVTLNGQGPIAQKALDGGMRLEVPPRDLMSQAAKDLPTGKIYLAIKDGVNAGNMPSYASQVPTPDRWAIAAYIRKAQGMGFEGKPAEPPPDPNVVSLSMGQWIYKNRGCNACHSLDGSRIVGPSWKGIYGKTEKTSAGEVTVDDAYIKESIIDPKAKIVEGYQPVMPPPTPMLTDKEIASVTLFIKSLQ